MMSSVALALFWHQHQPYYPDDLSGENPMPWVRLHGTKDYIGMAIHLDEVPEFRCTVNFVPSLLAQIERYVSGSTDRHLDISRTPADSLRHDDALHLLDTFFMANADTMIRPHARYAELYQQRAFGISTTEQALLRFRDRDLRDLQVWSNLAWIHPLLFDTDADLAELRAKGRHFTEEEKLWMLDRQREILARIIPLHRAQAERGQIELTTTPYYHPILPLLLDKSLAREAMPDVTLPRERESYESDAREHLRRAIESHRRHFGADPRGMWPSEGSVCQSLIPLLADHGISWIATDEEILGCSTGGTVSRDGRGHVRNPEQLYQAWRAAEGNHQVAILFRDHALSDQVGFHYQRTAGQVAASDFLAKIHAIGHACRHQAGTIVPVVLDGENCWEYFPDGGVSFLRTLYQNAVRDPSVRPVRVSDHLRDNPPRDTLPRLFAGSWISHNFAIWIGHPEDNRAWDLLHETRAMLVREAASGRHSPRALLQAWDEILIAEGSDWFWWFGDDHSSAQDALFDDLFRKHLRNVYTLLGQEPPGSLFTPIARGVGQRPVHTDPRSLLRVKLDGMTSYFEWIDAARYDCRNERGTMSQVSRGVLTRAWFGFDELHLLLRLDTEGLAREQLSDVDLVRIAFIDPPDVQVQIELPSTHRPVGTITTPHAPPVNGYTVQAACDHIFEVSLPFERLGVSAGAILRFYLELLRGDASVDRAPREGIFTTCVPTPDFERVMWQV
jgi:alpha-amylase/alpha-mannosidase (GH57 family)